MKFVSAAENEGNLEVDVEVTSEEVIDFRTRYDGPIRTNLSGVVEFYHPIDHPAKNRLRVIVGGRIRPNESADIAGRRVYDELAQIMRNA